MQKGIAILDLCIRPEDLSYPVVIGGKQMMQLLFASRWDAPLFATFHLAATENRMQGYGTFVRKE